MDKAQVEIAGSQRDGAITFVTFEIEQKLSTEQIERIGAWTGVDDGGLFDQT